MGTTLTFIPAPRASLFHLIVQASNRRKTRFGCRQAVAAPHRLAPVMRHNPHDHPIIAGENK